MNKQSPNCDALEKNYINTHTYTHTNEINYRVFI